MKFDPRLFTFIVALSILAGVGGYWKGYHYFGREYALTFAIVSFFVFVVSVSVISLTQNRGQK